MRPQERMERPEDALHADRYLAAALQVVEDTLERAVLDLPGKQPLERRHRQVGPLMLLERGFHHQDGIERRCVGGGR
jgi:hypothetical protein